MWSYDSEVIKRSFSRSAGSGQGSLLNEVQHEVESQVHLPAKRVNDYDFIGNKS